MKTNIRKAVIDRMVGQISGLLVDDPLDQFENQCNSKYNKFKFDKDGKIFVSDSSKYTDKTFACPRLPNANFFTPLRFIYRKLNYGPTISRAQHEPSIFIHIINGQKDTNNPLLNARQPSRVNWARDYLDIAINCVLKDETDPEENRRLPEDLCSDKANVESYHYLGNGQTWRDQDRRNLPVQDLSALIRLDGDPYDSSTQSLECFPKAPQFHRDFDDQATGLIQDLESLVAYNTITPVNEQFLDNNESDVLILNTDLVEYGPIPDINNTPTNVFTCIYRVEFYYRRT